MAKSLRGEIEVELGGVSRRLRLGIGDLEELEDRVEMGLPEFINVIVQGKYRLSHLREVLNAGLTGAGWSGTDDDIRDMIQQTGPGEVQVICLRLINVGLGNEDSIGAKDNDSGNGAAPEESPSRASPSGAISK